MIPVTFDLTPSQHARLTAIAKAKRISLGRLLQEGVNVHLHAMAGSLVAPPSSTGLRIVRGGKR